MSEMSTRLNQINAFLRAFDEEAERQKTRLSGAFDKAHATLDVVACEGIPIDHPAKLAAIFRNRLARAARIYINSMPLDRPHYSVNDALAALMQAVQDVENPDKDIRVSRNTVNGDPMVTISWLPCGEKQRDPRTPRWVIFEGEGIWTPRADGFPFVKARVQLNDISGTTVDLDAERILFGARAGDLVLARGVRNNTLYVEGMFNTHLLAYDPEGKVHITLHGGTGETTRVAEWGSYNTQAKLGFNPLVNFARFKKLLRS